MSKPYPMLAVVTTDIGRFHSVPSGKTCLSNSQSKNDHGDSNDRPFKLNVGPLR